MDIRIGTRGSRLAMTQTGWVASRCGPDDRVEIVTIASDGDRDRTSDLSSFGGTGIFTSALEEALRNGEIDAAVHSMKDMPVEIPDDMAILAVPEREDPCDLWVSPSSGPDELPDGARVGTGSPRRIAQLSMIREGLECIPIRGNLDTRLEKLADGEYEALVVAAAGVNRLGLEVEGAVRFDPGRMLPAPGQGALAIECRSEDVGRLCGIRESLHHEQTSICANAERALLGLLGGGCHMAMGALAELDGGDLRIRAFLKDDSGPKRVELRGSLVELPSLVEAAAKALTGS